MSLPEAEDGKPNSSLPANYDPEQQQQQQQQQQQTLLEAKPPSSSRGTNSNTSSNNNNNDNNNNNLQISHQKFQTEESDEDLFRVPDVEAPPPVNSAAISKAQNDAEVQHGKRGRGRNPADKEYRRLKRLLRNRVSAQQARERKKIYVNDLELRAKELDERNSKLEEKISTLTNENTMLRKILMNTRPKADENIEPEQDKLVKS